MLDNITKEQQETLFMNEIDANAYHKMKHTTEDTQHQFCEQFIKNANDKDIMLLFRSVLEKILELKIHPHSEIRDEVYLVFSDTEMDDMDMSFDNE